jgi:hypothetical protein
VEKKRKKTKKKTELTLREEDDPNVKQLLPRRGEVSGKKNRTKRRKQKQSSEGELPEREEDEADVKQSRGGDVSEGKKIATKEKDHKPQLKR